ncbi:uncharacterized protein LOC107830513 [Nicotiana tabacum]|uniref:Uncharacterized protein LOC107830513 n=1 Tax=Nicotiana tabacum TaxID=4097 RepID=A0AC58TC52_TOBAC
MSSSEKLAMFLNILAHYEKNISIKVDYVRSGWSVSQAFNECLRVVLRLAPLLLVNPKPVLEDEIEDQWRWFKMDPKAKSMKTKKWPMFEDWEEIFGKDRATGEFAEGLLNATEDILRSQASGLSNDMSLGWPIVVDEEEEDDVGD